MHQPGSSHHDPHDSKHGYKSWLRPLWQNLKYPSDKKTDFIFNDRLIKSRGFLNENAECVGFWLFQDIKSLRSLVRQKNLADLVD
jgi:hypothetical protein